MMIFSKLHSSMTSKQTIEDVIFRKVRGILNKITPETFDKLSKELVNVGLDSPRRLRGVIYLLFDKALKDLKYSSLYAKLCQELSERAPNFEQEPGPNTFCKFLISKCEDEFERRRKATEDFDSKNDLTDEEYEQRAIAKQKMLGNIKFICELGKKRLLQEEILHECIRGLLSKKKERSIQDQAQDLECLCQIMRTIGSLLDIQASRNLMNQYFERIDMFSKKPELPSRIRFMLRDVIDLRDNNWRPRPFQREDNVPQPLSKLREESGYDPAGNSSIDKFGNFRNLLGNNDLTNLRGNKLTNLLDDGPSYTTTSDFHWGSSFLPNNPLEQTFDPFAMGNYNTSKPVQKLATTLTGPDSISGGQNLTLDSHKSNYFNMNDAPLDQRFLDRKPDFLRPSLVKQIPTSNDMTKLSDGTTSEIKRFSDNNFINVQHEREPHLAAAHGRSKPSANVPFNPIKAPRGEISSPYQGPRQSIGSRPTIQPVLRGQPTQQYGRPSNRRFDHRENIQQIDQISPKLQQQPVRPNQRFIEARSQSPPTNFNPEFRERRPPHPRQDSYHEQNLRFSNNHRLAKPERSPRSRDSHYQFERSSKESETNQNWRSGPTNALVVVNNSRHMDDPPSRMDHPIIQRPQPRSLELDNVVKSHSARISNPRSDQGHGFGGTMDVSKHKRSSIDRELVDHIPRFGRDVSSQISKDQSNSEVQTSRVHNQRVDHFHPMLSNKFIDPRQPPHYDRKSNVSPPRLRNREPIQRHPTSISNPTAQQSFRQNSRSNDTEVPKPMTNQKVIIPTPQEPIKIHQKSAHVIDQPSSPNDRKFKPITRSNNPSISSDLQDPDRVSNWRKTNNNPVAPLANAKSSPKETMILNSPILTKPLTKISDQNFSLRPSHNLIGTRSAAHKLSSGVEEKTTANNNVQPDSGLNKVSTNEQIIISSTGSSSNERNTCGNSSSNDNHNKSAARDFHVNKFISALSEHSDESNLNVGRIANKVKELKIPKSYQADCLVSMMKQSILKSENDRDNMKRLMAQLMPATFEVSALLCAFKVIFKQLQALEVEIPKVKSLVAGFLSQAILDGLLSLEEVGDVLSGGKHHPLFLLCLQKLGNNAGQAWLNERFVESKIDLMDMLPEVDRSKDRLASILKDRCLGFLDPMLTIEPDLWSQMKEKDPSPAAIYRWIKDNVDPTIQSTPMFVHVLMTCLLRYIHEISPEKVTSLTTTDDKDDCTPQPNKSSPSLSSQAIANIEKELLSKYQQMLQAILKDKGMQLATLYSLQSFYHGLDFPKGALLRWFHQMYDLNIVDDDVYFTWKEEINDTFPGKGQALFQVNTWLNWLAKAESEEEEEEV